MMKKTMNGFLLVVVIWVMAFSGLAQEVGTRLTLREKRSRFIQGKTLFEKKDYEKALQIFHALDAHYPELQDYVSYFLGKSLQKEGKLPDALNQFQQFLLQFPTHPLGDEVRFAVANIFFEMKRYPEALTWYKKLDRQAAIDEGEWLYKIGVTFMHTGNERDAVTVFHKLLTSFPRHAMLKSAKTSLRKILVVHPDLAFEWTETSLLEYAHTLLKVRMFKSAMEEYKAFQQRYPKSIRIGESEFGIADAYFRSGSTTKGTKTLQQIASLYAVSQPEIAAKAIYTIGKKHWDADRNRHAKRFMQRIVTEFRETSWGDDAYYVLGRIYQSQKRYHGAGQWFVSLYTHYPESPLAEEALWRAGWSLYLARHYPRAIQKFSQAIISFPNGSYTDDSLYWKGRCLEKRQNQQAAITTYQELVNSFPATYYGIQAQKRLNELQVPTKAASQRRGEDPELTELLSRWARAIPLQLSQEILGHAYTSFELHEVQLPEYARQEIEWIDALLKKQPDALKSAESQVLSLYALGRLYAAIGEDLKAIQLVWKIESLLETANIQSFPYSLERLYYPLSYWELIKKYAAQHTLDPFLVAGIIRQESAYNPMALSYADARGLMQLLPTTGRLVAKQLRLKNYSTAQLYEPEPNISLGTAYIAGLLERFDGDLFRAIAAYNAGPNATKKWWPAKGDIDHEEIVENITYRATQNYVKHVLRNQYNYRHIYPELLSASH